MFRKLLCASVLALSSIAILHAQDVKDAGSDGLMKTVTYDVAHFTDIRDKKLSDVLEKMPGISGSGTWFSYNGMGIAKVYINGADVLEGNTQPVYNLKPEDVERVEITENHISINVMRGKMYSNSASINVVLKESASGRWSGSIKAMAGAAPLLGTADINALKLGAKAQTTIMVKADNTGLDFAMPLHGWGDYGAESDYYNEDSYTGADGVNGGFDYNVRRFLDVEPSLAPLSSERVRFNRSAVAQIGSTRMLSKDYQLNMQVTLHGNRLTADSQDETTYFMEGGEEMYYGSGEQALMHQYDLQSSLTLLSNTDRQFLRNQLIFNYRRIDMTKDISGTNPNSHIMDSQPVYLKDDFHIKRRVGKNILSINAMTGYISRPQHLNMSRFDEYGAVSEAMEQKVKSNSAFLDAGAKLDISLNRELSLALKAGAAYNRREMTINLASGQSDVSSSTDELGITNLYGSAVMTYINSRMQAKLELPVVFGGYSWNSWNNQTLLDPAFNSRKLESVFCFSPDASIKYDITNRISVSGNLMWSNSPVDRKRLYSGIVVKDFMQAMEGYPGTGKNKSFDASLQATYRNPEKSLFINGSLYYSNSKSRFLSIMRVYGPMMVSSYMIAPDNSRGLWDMESIDVNKGISSFKGKIGLSVFRTHSNDSFVRGDALLPYSIVSYNVSPYVNGRLAPWCNMIYKLSYNNTAMRMEEGDWTRSQSYTQSLELIFSPWKKLNFSLLGDHYYTEFTEDISKHLILVDFKAEYNLNDSWQILLTATNILNQKTYNYTLVDSSRFTRSYTSYTIRPLNVLLGVFFKF